MNHHEGYESEGYRWCVKCGGYNIRHKNKPHPKCKRCDDDEPQHPSYNLNSKDEAPEYD